MEKQNNTEKTVERFNYLRKLSKEDLQEVISDAKKELSDLSHLIELYTVGLAYILRTHNLPLTDFPDMLRTRLRSAFIALNFKRLLCVTGANLSSRQTPAPKHQPIKSVNAEKTTMAAFAVLFALFTLAALAGVILGHTYHAYTAILNAAISGICINEYKQKIK